MTPRVARYLVGLAIAAAAVWATVILALTEGKPVASVWENTANFGSVVEGSTVEVFYRVENRGTRDLEISAVDGGCGCVAGVSPLTISPGESDEIEVVLDTVGLLGRVSRQIVVTTNAPDTPTINLNLTGRVLTERAVTKLSTGTK